MGVGEMGLTLGGYTTLANSACHGQLPAGKPWSMTGGAFVCFLAQTCRRGNAPFTL